MADTSLKQVSSIPTTKVMVGTLAGAISAVIVWALNASRVLPDGMQVPGDIAAALTTIISFIVAYFMPPSERDRVEPQPVTSSAPVTV